MDRPTDAGERIPKKKTECWMALGYGPKVCSTYLRINGYTILGCWLDVCHVGYFMGYTYHWMYGYGVFLDLQEQPLHIVFRQSVTKPSITSTQTVIAIMEDKFIIKLL